MEHNATVVALSGEYDIARRDELDQLLDRFGDADPLVFNVAAVERLDTAVLRSLVRFQRARKEAGKSPLVLAKPTERLREFFRTLDLHETFVIRDEL